MSPKDPYLVNQAQADVVVLSEQIRRARAVMGMKQTAGYDIVSEWLSKRHDALVNELMTSVTNDDLRMIQGGVRVIKEFLSFIQGTVDKGAKAEASLAATDKTRLL